LKNDASREFHEIREEVIPAFPFRFNRLRMALRLHLRTVHGGEGSNESRAYDGAANF